MALNNCHQRKHCKTAKIILLGSSNVGKTALIIRWNTGHFNKNAYSTIGAALTSKSTSFGKDENVQLNVWDTSGSERFDSMTTLYYRDAQAAILCYEITDHTTLDRARYWAYQLKEHQPTCLIYLCATKIDLLQDIGIQEEVTDAMSEEFKQELGARHYFRTSSKTGDGVAEVFDTVALNVLAAAENNSRITVDHDCGSDGCLNCFS